MTNKTAHDVTDEERTLARKWAKSIESRTETWTACTRAAVRVILDAVPAPTPPTLADMTEDERDECQWMQADVKDYEITAGIIAKINQTDAHLIASDGETWFLELDTVTPRPDLPRMEWPDADQGGEGVTKVDYVSVAGGRTAYGPWTVARLRKKADTTPALPEGWRLADHEDHGRVIVTNTTPNRNGYVYYVCSSDRDLTRLHWDSCTPDELTYIDQEADQ